MRYEHPLIASLLIGAAQEADLVSPGFEQSRAISNRSTLDFTLHCGEQRIVLPGDASWKRLCFSSAPPGDDDDNDERTLHKAEAVGKCDHVRNSAESDGACRADSVGRRQR